MKLLKLNEKGVAHYLAAVLVVVMIGAIGTYVMTQSHAETPSSVASTKSTLPDMVFVSDNDIYISKVGGKATEVTNSSNNAIATAPNLYGGAATFGLNGSIIFYIGHDNSNSAQGANAIESISTTGQNNKVIYDIPASSGYQFSTISWSETAQKLAVTEVSYSGQVSTATPYLLYTMNPDGSDLTEINYASSGYDAIYDPAVWSPNGTELAIEAEDEINNENNSNVALVFNVSTGSIVSRSGLCNNSDWLASWTADGQSLICYSPNSILTENITNNTGSTDVGNLPANNQINGATLSPDGNNILYTTWSTTGSSFCSVSVYNIPTNTVKNEDYTKNTYCGPISWSPDSNTFAYSLGKSAKASKPSTSPSQVWTTTIDSPNAHKVYQGSNSDSIQALDWDVQ